MLEDFQVPSAVWSWPSSGIVPSRVRTGIRTSDRRAATSHPLKHVVAPHEQAGAEKHGNRASTTKHNAGPAFQLTPQAFTSVGCAGAQRGLNTAISLRFERRFAAVSRRHRRRIRTSGLEDAG
jgi:hypothetical protein